jgi:hypothetical protein
LLAACDTGVKKIPLQHGVMLGEHWDDCGWVFGALAFMDGRHIRGHQHVKFSKSVSDRSTIEAGNDLATLAVRLTIKETSKNP